MRVRVLPRATASAVLTGAVSRMGWAVGAATVLMTFPMLVETFILRDRPGDLPLPILMLVVVLVGIAAVTLRPRPVVVVIYLLVSGAATVGYEVAVLAGDPSILNDSLYLVNRPTLALVAVGVTSVTAVAGISWTLLGFGVASGAGALAAAITGVAFRPGLGPAMVLAIAIIAYLTLATLQAALRRRVPNFDALEAETLELAHGADLARRTTAVVHDTVLNDLAVVMNAPDRLDDRARERLRDDLAMLRSEQWISQSPERERMSELEADLRNEVLRMISEFQWKGLSIHLTGGAEGTPRLDPEVGRALVAALQACLENVMRHSDATTAEIEVISDESAVTVMVTDRGVGFDPDSVAPDRIGLRSSVVERMEAVGGRVRIWSAPGEGTSILMTAPAAKAAS
jgi:signal transduction histidine kinase